MAHRKEMTIVVKICTPIDDYLAESLKEAFKAVAKVSILEEYIEVSEK